MTVFAVSHVMKNFAHTHNEALQVQNPALALTHGKWDRIIIIFQPGLHKAAWQNTKGPLLIPDHCLLLSATVYLALQQSTTVCGHVFLGSLFEVAPDTDFI